MNKTRPAHGVCTFFVAGFIGDGCRGLQSAGVEDACVGVRSDTVLFLFHERSFGLDAWELVLNVVPSVIHVGQRRQHDYTVQKQSGGSAGAGPPS